VGNRGHKPVTIERTTLDTARIGRNGTAAQMIEWGEEGVTLGAKRSIGVLPMDYTITPLEPFEREVTSAMRG
jgi:hypothetical protein